MKFLKRLFKKNWQVLAALAIDQLKNHLLGRVQLANPFFGSLLLMAVDILDQAIDKLTDNIDDDKAQMKQLMEDNYVEFISIAAAGGVTEIKDDGKRIQVIAILETTAQQLRGKVSNKSLLTN